MENYADAPDVAARVIRLRLVANDASVARVNLWSYVERGTRNSHYLPSLEAGGAAELHELVHADLTRIVLMDCNVLWVDIAMR